MSRAAPRRRRVLLVEEGGIGGVADYTAELARALAGAGWAVELATSCDNRLPPLPGVLVRPVFPYVRGGSRLDRALRRTRVSRLVNGGGHLLAALRLLPAARRSEMVHLQGGEWPPLTAAQIAALRLARRPVVHTPHNTFGRGRRSYRRSRALAGRLAAAVIVHSEHDRGILTGNQARSAVVIPHGEYGALARRGPVEADPQRARAALRLDGCEVVVLLFGQLRPDKGVADLLEAAAAVPEVGVVIAGEDRGALGHAGALLADPRLAGRVELRATFVPPAEIGTLFAAADVVALPYRRASASGVLLLAYAHARPVLAYPAGGLPEYVRDGTTGWLCSRMDVAALEQALREIVAAGRAECRLRGEAAQRLARERFAWGPIARRTIACYEEVLAPRGAGGVRSSG